MQNLKTKLGLNSRLSLLLPYVILSVLFIVLPTILLLVKAFEPSSGGVDNWAPVKDSTMWDTMLRSIWVGLAAALMALIIGLPFAFITATSNSKIFKVISMTLLVSPLFVFTIAKVSGFKGMLIMIFDSPEEINSSWMVAGGLTYINFPFMIIPLYSVFLNMPKSLVEASNDLGFNKVSTFVKVIVPYALKAIFSGLALVFMLSATSVVVSEKLPYLPGEHKMIGNEIYNRATNLSNDFQIAQASSIALITILVMSSVYGLLYIVPFIVKKINGGFNVKN